MLLPLQTPSGFCWTRPCNPCAIVAAASLRWLATSKDTREPADRLGNTPLHLAIDSAHAQTAALLIDVGGADRLRVNTDGIVPEQMEGVGGLEQKRVRDFLAQSFGPIGI